jgi:hypothetical protein
MALQTGLHPAQLKDSVTSEWTNSFFILMAVSPLTTTSCSPRWLHNRRTAHAGRWEGEEHDGSSHSGRDITRRWPRSEQELGEWLVNSMYGGHMT